jgi:hypothetical protein
LDAVFGIPDFVYILVPTPALDAKMEECIPICGRRCASLRFAVEMTPSKRKFGA